MSPDTSLELSYFRIGRFFTGPEVSGGKRLTLKISYWPVNTRVQLFQNILQNTHKVEIFWSGIFLHKCLNIPNLPTCGQKTLKHFRNTPEATRRKHLTYGWTHMNIPMKLDVIQLLQFTRPWKMLVGDPFFPFGMVHFQGPCETSTEQSFLSIRIMGTSCCTTAQHDFWGSQRQLKI